jgi:ACS family allantoate permease-like MFS transporter
MIEALIDPKTGLFALFAILAGVPNSINNQIQIIVLSFGFTALQTTLFGGVGGAIQIVAIYTGVTIASRIPNSRAWVGIAYFIPDLLGVFLVNLLPWHDKVQQLFALWITRTHDVLVRRGDHLTLCDQVSGLLVLS